MKKVLAVLKLIFWSPLVWLFKNAKALFVKEEPNLKAAAANLPGDTKTVWQKLKDLAAGLRAAWKAVKGWTWVMRVAVLIVLGAAFTGTYVVGHRVGHRKVPGLQHQVLDLWKKAVSDATEIAGLKADLAKAQADLAKANAAKASKDAPAKTSSKSGKSGKTPDKPKKAEKASSGISFSGFFN